MWRIFELFQALGLVLFTILGILFVFLVLLAIGFALQPRTATHPSVTPSIPSRPEHLPVDPPSLPGLPRR
jgi:hypothetical protein